MAQDVMRHTGHQDIHVPLSQMDHVPERPVLERGRQIRTQVLQGAFATARIRAINSRQNTQKWRAWAQLKMGLNL
jgi:hypothetical protein